MGIPYHGSGYDEDRENRDKGGVADEVDEASFCVDSFGGKDEG
jgi:hypothetical protein